MSKEVFLVRHAAAEEPDGSRPDAARALTDRGRERFARHVEALRRLDLHFDRLLHSPWLRAVQTAELLAPLVDGESEVTPLLTAPPEQRLLDRMAGRRVALVGHEPWLTELLALLAFGDSHHAARFDLKKGGVAWLEGELRPGSMSVRALFPPSVLRALA